MVIPLGAEKCQLLLHLCGGGEALHGMVIVRRSRRELAIASSTRACTCTINRRDPSVTMLAPDMNEQIGLHLRGMITAWTRMCRCRSRFCMCLKDVLHQPTLLNKALRTHGADIRLVSSVLLHMVEHRVLTCLRDPAIGAHELTLLILLVDEFRSGHRTAALPAAARFNF